MKIGRMGIVSIVAMIGCGVSSEGYSQVIAQQEAIPPKPMYVKAEPQLSQQALITWRFGSIDVQSFSVERCDNCPQPGHDFSEIAVVNGVNARSFTDTGRQTENTYSYRVRAINASGYSSYSNIAHMLMNVPSPPLNVVGTAIGSYIVAVTWSDNSTNETSFKLERKIDTGSFFEIGTVAANTMYYRDDYGFPGAVFTYRIRAVNGMGLSAYSNESSTQLLSIDFPAPPVNLEILQQSDGLSVEWGGLTSNVTSYVVEKKTAGGPFTFLASVPADSKSYLDTSAVMGQTYRYRVYSVNGFGNSGFSNIAQTTFGTPATPVGFSGVYIASPTPAKIELAWTDLTDNEASFRIEEFVNNQWVFRAVPGDNATFVHIFAPIGSGTHTYRIRASNGLGNSAWSPQIQVLVPGVSNWSDTWNFSVLTTGIDEPGELPAVFSLAQNFPNPFNPSTMIAFSIPRSGEVSLRVFNLLGEEVATLVSGNRNAGIHTVQWDAAGQPSGVYLYRLQAGEFTQTRKLVLLR